eukprot:1141380-Pelagomonas_calceolata.AAC.2
MTRCNASRESARGTTWHAVMTWPSSHGAPSQAGHKAQTLDIATKLGSATCTAPCILQALLGDSLDVLGSGLDQGSRTLP